MSKYTPFEIEHMLDSLKIICDSREQPNPRYRTRMKGLNCPYERRKLNYGDYTAEYTDADGKQVSLESLVVIERKMDADEICGCFTKGRKRFAAEFERAKADGAKVYLLIEGESWESLMAGEYRSKLPPKSLIASILAWVARYNLTLLFCKAESTGAIIKGILYYELRERLQHDDS